MLTYSKQQPNCHWQFHQEKMFPQACQTRFQNCLSPYWSWNLNVFFFFNEQRIPVTLLLSSKMCPYLKFWHQMRLFEALPSILALISFDFILILLYQRFFWLNCKCLETYEQVFIHFNLNAAPCAFFNWVEFSSVNYFRF